MLITTQDGSHSLFSEQYGVTYHSRHGAVTESAHVFIDAGLLIKAASRREINVLEAGLGSGLNAFMTRLEAENHGLCVNYTALEMYPVSVEQAAVLNYPALLQVPERTADFLQLHSCDWEKPVQLSKFFIFEKCQTPIQHFISPDSFDVIYFDAFSPQAQPELWTETVFANLYQSLKPDGLLVTYCAQGEFKRRLKRVGFQVERLNGPPGKREMTRAVKVV